MVGRQQVLVEKGNGGGSKWPRSRVAGVEAAAARQHCAKRGDVRGSGVTSSMAQPKAASGSGEGGLQPGLREKGPTAEALQTRPRSHKKLGRCDPKCKNHAAVGSAVTQEQKACLGVRKLCQSL